MISLQYLETIHNEKIKGLYSYPAGLDAKRLTVVVCYIAATKVKAEPATLTLPVPNKKQQENYRNERL